MQWLRATGKEDFYTPSGLTEGRSRGAEPARMRVGHDEMKSACRERIRQGETAHCCEPACDVRELGPGRCVGASRECPSCTVDTWILMARRAAKVRVRLA